MVIRQLGDEEEVEESGLNHDKKIVVLDALAKLILRHASKDSKG